MLKKIILGVVTLLLFAVVATVGVAFWWQQTSINTATQEALDALVSDERVEFIRNDWLVFEPKGQAPTTGFILYPGAQCDPRGYAGPLRAIAEQGFMTVAVPMPFNFAVFGIDEADRIMAAYPDIDTWVIGGHSLGGAMAAGYAAANPGKVDGLLFWDSHTFADADFSGGDLAVAQIHRSSDGQDMPQSFQDNRQYLPADAEIYPLKDALHMNFGAFNVNPRFAELMLAYPMPAEPMPAAEQRRRIVDITVSFLTRVSAGQPQAVD